MEDIAAELSQIVNEWVTKIESSDISWNNKASAERWSPKEVLGHLTDSALINLERFIRCTYESGFKLVYDQNQWVKTQRYQQADESDLLALWAMLNKKITFVLSDYPEGAQKNSCDIGKSGTNLQTPLWLAKDYLGHIQHHLQQISDYIL